MDGTIDGPDRPTGRGKEGPNDLRADDLSNQKTNQHCQVESWYCILSYNCNLFRIAQSWYYKVVFNYDNLLTFTFYLSLGSNKNE